MRDELIPCARCDRHVRSHERECPFCGVARATRGALLALGASFAVHVGAMPVARAAEPEDVVVPDVGRADLPVGSAPRPMMVQYGAPPPPPEEEPPPEVEPPEGAEPKPPTEGAPPRVRRNGRSDR